MATAKKTAPEKKPTAKDPAVRNGKINLKKPVPAKYKKPFKGNPYIIEN